MSKIRIVSDGSAIHSGTKVLVDGVELEDVSKITIHEMTPGKMVTATLEVVCVELDIELDSEQVTKEVRKWPQNNA